MSVFSPYFLTCGPSIKFVTFLYHLLSLFHIAVTDFPPTLYCENFQTFRNVEEMLQ